MTKAAQAAPSRVIDASVTLPLASGETLAGRLEYFPTGKSLVVFDEDGTSLEPAVLTVPATDAPDAHAALQPDQVLLRNWTEMRGAAAALADQGVIELTDQVVSIGMFQLPALVARVL